MWTYTQTNELYHYGVPGMKWGVRRAIKKQAKERYRQTIRKAEAENEKIHKDIDKKYGYSFLDDFLSDRDSKLRPYTDADRNTLHKADAKLQKIKTDAKKRYNAEKQGERLSKPNKQAAQDTIKTRNTGQTVATSVLAAGLGALAVHTIVKEYKKRQIMKEAGLLIKDIFGL